MTVVPEFIEPIEIHRITKANSTTHLRRACLYQMIKSGLLPNVRLFAFALAAVPRTGSSSWRSFRQKKTRPCQIGCKVSTTAIAEESGRPAALARSQKSHSARSPKRRPAPAPLTSPHFFRHQRFA